MSDDPKMSETFDIPALDPVRVERALRRLPHRERTALLSKRLERLSYAEIGVRLGVSPAKARALVAAALAKLHRRLFRPPQGPPNSRTRE